jgi:hypothetical protein
VLFLAHGFEVMQATHQFLQFVIGRRYGVQEMRLFAHQKLGDEVTIDTVFFGAFKAGTGIKYHTCWIENTDTIVSPITGSHHRLASSVFHPNPDLCLCHPMGKSVEEFFVSDRGVGKFGVLGGRLFQQTDNQPFGATSKSRYRMFMRMIS